MAKRYVAVAQTEDELVAVEVRAKSQKSATKQVLAVLDAACSEVTTTFEVSRMKKDGDSWVPVSDYVSVMLPHANLWLSPANVELTTNIKLNSETIAKEKKVKPITPVTPASRKAVDLGFTDEFIKTVGVDGMEYNRANEVKT